MKKKILCLDFDGVCHSYTSGWQGIGVISDPPVAGLFEFLEEAKEVFDIQIYSTRSSELKGIQAMKDWFSKYFTEYLFVENPEVKKRFLYFLCPDWLSFPTEKPPAFISLDDRVLTFTGEFPSIDELKAFKPWYENND